MAWLETQFCRSTGPIRAHIYAQFGLIYSHLGCVKLLHRLGFEYRKPKALPRVADEVKQADFIDFYESLLNTLPADEAVYFADAVNREYQSKPAFGWVKKGSNPAVKTTPGRGRVNIHGALCLENFDAPFIEPVTVNGNSAVQLLAKSKPTTQPDQPFTSFGTTRPITDAVPSNNGSLDRSAAYISSSFPHIVHT